MNLHNICQQFKLGELQQSESINAGLMHQSYRVSTGQGQFIIKQLNKSLPQYHDFAATEVIAKQFAEHGLAARYAIGFDSDVAVYHFIEGTNLTTAELSLAQITKIAQNSAQMHNMNLQNEMAPAFVPFKTTAIEWDKYANHASLLDKERLQQFVGLQQQYDKAFARLSQHTVVSHRDFTPANLLWIGADPTIIDWELAGHINPDLEVLHNAIDVALCNNTIISPSLFHYIASYQAQRSLKQQPQDIINGLLGSWIHWILFCLKRQNQTFKPLDSANQLKKALMVIDFVEENREKLAAALAN